MITDDQASEYLVSQGIENTPSFILAALVEQANSVNDCLTANYSEATALLIQCYLISLLAMAQTDKYISSQSAPSGASRSFTYKAFADRWRGQLVLLRGLDKNGCASSLIPPDPTNTSHGGIWVAKSGCMCS